MKSSNLLFIIVLLIASGILIYKKFYKKKADQSHTTQEITVPSAEIEEHHHADKMHSHEHHAKGHEHAIETNDHSYVTKHQVEELFKKLGRIYGTQMKFDTKCKSFENMSQFDYSLYKENKEKYNSLSEKYEAEIVSNYIAPMYIKWINSESRYGCFASTDILSDKYLGSFAGMVMLASDADENTHSMKYPAMGHFAKKFPVDTIISCDKYGSETSFIHMRKDIEHNAKIELIFANNKWVTAFISTKPINKDEEIVVGL